VTATTIEDHPAAPALGTSGPGAPGSHRPTLDELDLDELGCEVSAIRRRGIRAVEPAPETRLEEGDVVVLLGDPEAIAAAEERLLKK
jgi:CPA2 family monovalent cation:H+ antiporter-2